MTADMTNAEVDEAVALALGYEQKGWCPKEWATSVDACLDDILPAVKLLYPEGWWNFYDRKEDGWEARFMNVRVPSIDIREPAPALARAICLVFLTVVKAHKKATVGCPCSSRAVGDYEGEVEWCPIHGNAKED